MSRQFIHFSNYQDRFLKFLIKVKMVAAAAATAGAVTILGPLALTAAGFGAGGVGAGTMAAAWQSTIGNVAAGSTFAS